MGSKTTGRGKLVLNADYRIQLQTIFIFTTMKCKVLLTFLIFVATVVIGQNLVPNPSFEEYLECPFSTAELDNQVIDWYSWQMTPDFFHPCSDEMDGFVGVPENVWGYQWPITGEAYAALITYEDHNPGGREYIAAQLNDDLIPGQTYYLMFHVSRSEEHT